MFRLFEPVVNRIKAMFTIDAVLDLEHQFLTRQAERRADLIRTADRYQREGLAVIAADLRRQAESLSEQRPLQTVQPFLSSEAGNGPNSHARALPDRGHRRGKPLQLPNPVSSSSRKKGKG